LAPSIYARAIKHNSTPLIIQQTGPRRHRYAEHEKHGGSCELPRGADLMHGRMLLAGAAALARGARGHEGGVDGGVLVCKGEFVKADTNPNYEPKPLQIHVLNTNPDRF
jgi:hypothetical protein